MDSNIKPDPGIYFKTLHLLEETFLSPDRRLKEVIGLAQRIKLLFEKISPFIQQTSGIICPHCTNVCCISKHGFHNYEDLVYLFALGLRPPLVDFGRNDYDPCPFLTEKGCSMERSVRPSGCNWYFCDPLLEVIEKRQDYHDFDDLMRDLADLWMKMIDDFSQKSPLPSL